MGSWGKIIGFLRSEGDSVAARKAHRRVLMATAAVSLFLFLAAVFYLRQISAAGSPQSYLYLEVGGTLLCFSYAANALVRFRGTHDRTALILAFGFVLSGIIETVSCFGLNGSLISGALALSRIPMGWMVSRTLLAVLMLAAIAVDRHRPAWPIDPLGARSRMTGAESARPDDDELRLEREHRLPARRVRRLARPPKHVDASGQLDHLR